SDIFKSIRRIIEIAAVVLCRAAPLARLLENEGLGALNASQRQITSLDTIAVVFHQHQIDMRAVQHTDNDDGQQRHAPKQTDQNGASSFIGLLELASPFH